MPCIQWFGEQPSRSGFGFDPESDASQMWDTVATAWDVVYRPSSRRDPGSPLRPR
jgi:hypothetical protein